MKEDEASTHTTGNTIDSTNTAEKKIVYILPNDEIRHKVVPQLEKEKDKLLMDTLLTLLDEKNLSFCEFVRLQFVLDDSCYAVAKKDYPDPWMQEKFVERHNKAFKIAEPKFFKRIGISKRWGDIAVIAYAFNAVVKNFCGRY